MLWFHVTTNLFMIALDAIWWYIAMRLAKGLFLRVFISLFMAAETAGIVYELLETLGAASTDIFRHLPEAVNSAVIIWHYLVLPGLSLTSFACVCAWLIRRWRAKAKAVLSSKVTPVAGNAVSRRAFIGACASVAPSLCTLGLMGVAVGELNRFRVRRFVLTIPSMPRALDGLTIAHVSDVHVGEWTHGEVLDEMVETTNAMRVDVIAATGDLINYNLSDLPRAMSLLSRMESRYGLWMVEGNHDLYENAVEFDRRVKDAGLRLLLDEADATHIRGCPVQFLGIRWMEGFGAGRDEITALQLSEVMKRRQPDAFPIFLAHHPHAFDAAVNAGLPLTLTGHTHGGQLMLDNQIGVGPALFRYWSGLYKRGNSQMIVSNGVGNMFPIRINAPAEIVHITLRCA